MGYANGLSVDPAQMHDLGAQTTANAQEYWSELSQLRENVESLRGIWHGQASDSFDTSYRNQDALFKEFEERLEQLGRALMTSATNFADTESDLTAAGNSLFND